MTSLQMLVNALFGIGERLATLGALPTTSESTMLLIHWSFASRLVGEVI